MRSFEDVVDGRATEGRQTRHGRGTDGRGTDDRKVTDGERTVGRRGTGGERKIKRHFFFDKLQKLKNSKQKAADDRQTDRPMTGRRTGR